MWSARPGESQHRRNGHLYAGQHSAHDAHLQFHARGEADVAGSAIWTGRRRVDPAESACHERSDRAGMVYAAHRLAESLRGSSDAGHAAWHTGALSGAAEVLSHATDPAL